MSTDKLQPCRAILEKQANEYWVILFLFVWGGGVEARQAHNRSFTPEILVAVILKLSGYPSISSADVNKVKLATGKGIDLSPVTETLHIISES